MEDTYKQRDEKLRRYFEGNNAVCPQCKKKSILYWSENWEEDRSRIVDPLYDLVEYNCKTHVMCIECDYQKTQNFTYYYDCRYDLNFYNISFDNKKCEFVCE